MTKSPAAPDLGHSLLTWGALSVLPRPALELVIRHLSRNLEKRHPGLRQRLESAHGKSYAFVLPDMPFNMTMTIQHGRLIPAVCNKDQDNAADVVIRARSNTLLSLLQGERDGDSMFFSRELHVEGNMETLVLLRNALDNETIDFRQIILSSLGPLSPLAAALERPVLHIFERFSDNISRVHEMMMTPIFDSQTRYSDHLKYLDQRVTRMEKSAAKKHDRANVRQN